MRFTKQNIERAFDKFMQGGNDSFADLKERIMNLVDEPEKVEVPDWFDQWYKKLIVDCSYHESKALVLINQCGDGHVLENFDGGIFGGTVKNSVIYTGWINSNRELASRAILDGYEVEEEQKYYVNIGDLYLKEPLGDTSDFTISMTWNREYAYPFDSLNMAREHASELGGTVEKV